MYVSPNFPTKKKLKEAVEAGERIKVFQPGPFNKGFEESGWFPIEGPHFPQPHKWYAQVRVKDYLVVEVK